MTSTPDWITRYTLALNQRDDREKSHKEFIDAYTRLADRTSSSLSSTTVPLPTSSTQPTHSSNSGPDLETLRADLQSTQKARNTLATRLEEVSASLAALQTTHRDAQRQVHTLTRTRLDLERKVKDREDELRGKQRLVTQAQDEMVALGLQLNLSEQKQETLEKENKELVERWMRRMGEEADRVNRESDWK